MKRCWFVAVALLGLGVAPAQARVQVQIDLSAQRMYVESATGSWVWPISSAKSGFSTPRGSYAPTSLQRMHYSRKYDMTPMPWSIFFRGGYAIHGTSSISQLGRPASHGCVRLAPGNAAALFAMVQREGARISITGAPPRSGPAYASRRSVPRYATGYRGAPAAYAPYGAPVYYPAVRAWEYNPYGW